MGDTVPRILFYGLIAAASPLAFAATIAVLKSARARLNGLIFASAFLLGESLVVLIVFTVGSIAAPGQGGKKTFVSVLELALGLLLLGVAARIRRGTATRATDSGGRAQQLLARLEGLTAAVAFSAGLLLGIGGPKRLTISVLAATSISAAGLTRPESVAAGALYVLVAGVLIWVPVPSTWWPGSGRRRGSPAARSG